MARSQGMDAKVAVLVRLTGLIMGCIQAVLLF